MTIITIGHGLTPFVGGVAGALNLVKGADLAAAPTSDLGGATGNYLTLTGNGVSVSALGTAPAGAERVVRFAGAVTLVHNAATLILPGGSDITTAADDLAIFVSEGAGAWRCVAYTLAAYAPGSGGGGGGGGVGPRGPAGTPGSVWYSGAGAPASGTGVSGDYSLNLTSGDVFVKTAGGWGSAIANLKGAAGATGATGATGAAGSAGSAGSQWLEGSGAPSSGLGANGDFYLNTATGDVYTKASGSWGAAVGNIRGPQGPSGSGSPGATWYNGAGAPSAGTGVNGDYYLNTATGDVYAKAAGAWGSAVGSIKGAAGATGATGATGSAGAAGSVWYSGSGAPSAGTGLNGDSYLNTATGDVYTKAAGAWGSAVGSIKGATGATGSTGATGAAGAAGAAGSAWYSGSGVPSAGSGVNGDYYLNTANGDVYAKAAGAWGSAIGNLTGPSGGAGGAGDQFWYLVSGLIAGNNSANDTSWSGLSVTSNAITYSNTYAKYTPYSIQFNGSSSTLNVASPGDAIKFAGDFTIEMWIRPTSAASTAFIFDTRTGEDNTGIYAYLNTSSQIVVGNLPGDMTGVAVSLNTFHHLAISRLGTKQMVFIDGTLGTSATVNTANLSDGGLHIGSRFNGVSYFTGQLAHFRITKGVCRYGATFTPPTAAFATNGY